MVNQVTAPTMTTRNATLVVLAPRPSPPFSGGLREEVTHGRAEGTGKDVGGPEGRDGVEAALEVSEGDQCDEEAEQSGGGEVAEGQLFADQVTGGEAGHDQRGDRQPQPDDHGEEIGGCFAHRGGEDFHNPEEE